VPHTQLGISIATLDSQETDTKALKQSKLYQKTLEFINDNKSDLDKAKVSLKKVLNLIYTQSQHPTQKEALHLAAEQSQLQTIKPTPSTNPVNPVLLQSLPAASAKPPVSRKASKLSSKSRQKTLHKIMTIKEESQEQESANKEPEWKEK